MRGDFTDQTTVTGVLLIVYSLNNDSNVYYFAIDKGSEQDFDVHVSVTKTEYRVSVFTMENGLPFPRVVTLPQVISVVTNGTQGLCTH